MTSVLPCFVTFLIAGCHSVEENYFKVKMNQNLGYLQCERKCTERRGCTDTDYSPESLSCTLRFNLSDIRYLQNPPSCGTHYCTECLLQTRSNNISVLEVFYDTVKQTISTSTTSYEPLLSFETAGGIACNHSGYEEIVIKPFVWGSCDLISVQTLKNDKSYSWLLTVVQSKYVNHQNSLMLIAFQKYGVNYGKYFVRRNYPLQDPSHWERIQRHLRLVLHRGVLHVTDTDSKIELTSIKVKENINGLRLYIELVYECNCQLKISQEHSQP